MTRSGAQEGKSERRVIPDRGVEARVPRGEGRATIEGGAQIGWRVVPIEDRAVGMPGVRRAVADGVGQTIARVEPSWRSGGSGRLQVEPLPPRNRSTNRRR